MIQFIRRLNKVEKGVVIFLIIIAFLSGVRIVKAFAREYTAMLPEEGGVYTEGMVGKLGILNPLFTHQGSVGHDLTQLLFSGLSKYDPKTKSIVPDMAKVMVSPSGKEYTFVIKEGAVWHDGEPVTSADVIFTYETVLKNPEFKGAILNYLDLSGLRVAKIDERTVRFFLEKPDSFFLVKTIVGLLPAHLLATIPPGLLAEAPFNVNPIGSGRYRFSSLLPATNNVEISLEAFSDFYGEVPHIPNLLFKVFSDSRELGKNLGSLDGVRHVTDDLSEKVSKNSKFVTYYYHLPQYVAVFLNTESPVLKNKKVRLALQLGTDKESLIKALGESQAIDTPLLEIDQQNWVHQYSVVKANGALFDTEWKLPEKNLTTETGKQEAEEPHYINNPNGGNDWKTIDSKVMITGTVPPKTKTIWVNDYELKKYVPGDKGWSYLASSEFKNLNKGENRFDVYAVDFADQKTLIDSILITQGNETSFQMAEKEKLTAENSTAASLPFRVNKNGETLRLRLITSENPGQYSRVADLLKAQWGKIGVELTIDVLPQEVFQERLIKRDYDLVIFGQNLGYNLDAYPYWHSSQAKEGGLNLSQFKNFAVDSLLEQARLQAKDDERKKILESIQRIISTEVPAIFLYTPTYSLAQSNVIQHDSFENFATPTDRLAYVETWYAQADFQLKEGVTPFTFVKWLVKQF